MKEWFAYEVVTETTFHLWADLDAAKAFNELTHTLKTCEGTIVRVTIGRVKAETVKAAHDKIRANDWAGHHTLDPKSFLVEEVA